MQVSKASILSLAQSFMIDGTFSRVITKDDIPKKFREQFRASCWTASCMGFPFLQLRFGYADYYFRLSTKISTPPKLIMEKHGFLISFKDLIVNFNVSNSENNKRLLKLVITASFSVKPSMTHDRLHWTLEKKDFKFTETKSYIGVVPGIGLIANMALAWAIVPKLNSLGNEGFQLPLGPCWKMKNSHLDMLSQGFIAASDFNFG